MGFLEKKRDLIRHALYPAFDWIRFDTPTSPILPEGRPEDWTVSLVVTAGAHLSDSQPGFENVDPQGDDTYRVIPSDTKIENIGLSHRGYNTKRSIKDLDTVFPISLLNRYAEEGRIGKAAARHYSFMGYIPHETVLMEERVPEVASMLKEDGVDLVLLVPS